MSESSVPTPDFASSPEWERLRAVLRLLPMGVFLVDANGRMVETNEAAEALWGGRVPHVGSIPEYREYQAWWPDTGRRLEPHEWGLARALLGGETVLNQELDIVAFDGARRTILNSATPLYGRDGALMGAVAVNVDITQRKVTERAEAFLSGASRLLAESLEWEPTLKAVARLATHEWADYCLLDMLGENGTLQRLALFARNSERQTLLDRAMPYPARLDGDTVMARAMREGRAMLTPDITSEWLERHARSPEHLRLMEELAPRSMLALPLVRGERRFGLITLISTSQARRYTPMDLAYAEEFARRAALAVDSARLYRQAQEALRERDASLALLRAFLAASPVGMAFLDRELRYVHINPVLADFNGVPPEAHLGRTPREVLGPHADTIEKQIHRVLHTGEPAVDALLVDPRPGEPRQFLQTYFPVRLSGETLGVGATVREVTEQKQEEQRLRFLADATARLSTSLDWRTTLRTVAEVVVGQVADYCTVDMLAPDGEQLERVEARASDPNTQRLLDQSRFPPPPGAHHSPIRRVLRTGQPELVSEAGPAWLESIAVSPEHRQLMEAMGPRSVMFVPLVARGRTLGVVSAASQNPSRRYGGRDLAFLEDLAARAALAVDNAWLYRDAEAAVTARDEFVAIATHELRTPLSALQLQLASLQRATERETPIEPERLRQGVASARRQAERLAHLVNHLFDVTRISTGRLELQREEVDLSALAHRLVTRMEDALANAGCAAAVHADAPVKVFVDRLRVEQVLMNLLSNAMKYAPGQPVELSVEDTGDTAVVVVRDWGPGIPREAHARIFERFERATGEHARASLGLGLYISRQIARAHGGELTVEPPPEGPGTRFVLRLPRG
ncbi:PAS domain-containing protein [Pyxidicoccus fallax]|uniref:histidine kinase n=1 Tax=Pyxidicoccus fallax TaxID=394095 RepID=A0A848LY31_9BACT|nr:PAS domain-containing protein [Pyxidicoccus fallax]NMO22531.1 PAS domain-containing protein [Pyxidicoccus fallax]NPC84601.1 PAS domain-containing protein [Pyxidicoccus fallax]